MSDPTGNAEDMLDAAQDQISELERLVQGQADKAAFHSNRCLELEAKVESLEWENKGVAEWRSMAMTARIENANLKEAAKAVVDEHEAMVSEWGGSDTIEALAALLEEDK